ncbi:hypothetical protein [Frankia casuarinae]|nr:hypothetical protein [Frankia casuarinae]
MPEDPRSSYSYFTDPAPVRITVPTGWWRLLPTTGADGARDVTAQLVRWPGETSTPAVIVTVARLSLWELEQTLRFPFPRAVHTTFAASPRRDALVFPGPSGGWQVAHGQLLLDVGLDQDERPWRASRVDLTGREPATYGRLLHTDPPLRTWQRDLYQVDVVGAGTDDGVYGSRHDGSRHNLTYRVWLGGDVVFAGDDVMIPAGWDPRSDDAVREVIGQVIYQQWDRRELSFAQQSFLDVHRECLALESVGLPPPYPAGTRVRVDSPGGMTATGTIRRPVVRGGRTTGYLWRPDVADLPGHPGHGHPGYLLRADAAQVRATLEGKDTAVDGPDGPMIIAFGATVAAVDDPRFARGKVLRALDEEGRLAYDIQPDDDLRACHRLHADDVIPLTGTAWPTVDRLLQARDAAHVPLIAGEILVTVREIAVMPAVDPPVANALVRHGLLSPDRVLDPDTPDPISAAYPDPSGLPGVSSLPDVFTLSDAVDPDGPPPPRFPEPPSEPPDPGIGPMGMDL